MTAQDETVKKTESIRIHLDEDTLDDLERLAAHDSRTVSEYVYLVLQKHMYGHQVTRRVRERTKDLSDAQSRGGTQ